MEARANTILHELAHMWFGDLVTMKWWNDLWLNESFAEFMSHLALAEATKYTEGWTGFMVRKDWGLKQDQLPTTHPITLRSVTWPTLRSTSTASPTPRAPPCCASSSPTWDATRSSRACTST